MIAERTDFEGKIVWDKSKPDGQPRRMLDTTRAQKEFDFKAKMGFEQGLKILLSGTENKRTCNVILKNSNNKGEQITSALNAFNLKY